MARADEAWTTELSSGDPPIRDAAAADLRDFLARTLQRGFGQQIDAAQIDDLAQESMVRVTAKLDNFAGRSKFTTWAAAIAVNLALGKLRKRKYQEVSLEAAVESAESDLAPDTSSQQNSRDRILAQAIDEALSDRQRTALLAELGGLPMVEVARRMDTTRGALYKLLHDARKKLRAYFEHRGITLDELLLDEGGGV